jgi:hypothetical protein
MWKLNKGWERYEEYSKRCTTYPLSNKLSYVSIKPLGETVFSTYGNSALYRLQNAQLLDDKSSILQLDCCLILSVNNALFLSDTVRQSLAIGYVHSTSSPTHAVNVTLLPHLLSTAKSVTNW